MKNVVCVLVITLLSACSSQPIVIDRIPFDLSEFQALARAGNATVKGQAFLRTTDGEIHYPQKEQARLNPKTSYSEQWYQVNYLDRQNIAKPDPRYLDYVYKVDFDPQGHFVFNNIPPGDYYLSAPIFWFNEVAMEDGSVLLKRQGSFICIEVHVEDGDVQVANITTDRPVEVALSQ